MTQPTHNSAVRVVDYDPDWVPVFGRLRDRIWPVVCDVAIAIEHVGSTSVPGMAAKPVIDVDLVIVSRSEVPSMVSRLGLLGYEHQGNLGIEDREAFLTPRNQPAHHLYVCLQNSLALRNHIGLREHLRAHPSDAAAYSTLKKRLAERFPYERELYMAAKTNFILSLLQKQGFSAGELDSIRSANQRSCPPALCAPPHAHSRE